MLRVLIICLALSSCAGSEPLLRLVGSRDRGALLGRQQVFAGPEGMPRVELLNLLHLGDQGFYQQVQARLGAAEVVILEGLRSAPGSRPDTSFASAPHPHRQLAASLGLVYQLDVLRADPNFRRVDLFLADYRRMRAVHGPAPEITLPDFSRQLAEEVFYLLSRSPGLNRRQAQAKVMRVQGRFLLAEVLVRQARRVSPDPVSRLREERALAALAPSAGTWVYSWGHVHGPGLARGLRARGYRLVAERWVPIFAWGPGSSEHTAVGATARGSLRPETSSGSEALRLGRSGPLSTMGLPAPLPLGGGDL